MMKTTHIKSLASEARKKMRISRVTDQSLRSLIQSQGYAVVEFYPHALEPDLEMISQRFDLSEYFSQQNGFTFASAECRFVFINANLSNEEKMVVLAHEEGHIACEHMDRCPVLGRSVLDEDEANQFSFYLLHPTVFDTFRSSLSNHWHQILIFLLVLAVIGFSVALVMNKPSKNVSHPVYYVTADGEKYHEKDCMTIKNHTGVRKITEDELLSGKYEACKVCLP